MKTLNLLSLSLIFWGTSVFASTIICDNKYGNHIFSKLQVLIHFEPELSFIEVTRSGLDGVHNPELGEKAQLTSEPCSDSDWLCFDGRTPEFRNFHFSINKETLDNLQDRSFSGRFEMSLQISNENEDDPYYVSNQMTCRKY